MIHHSLCSKGSCCVHPGDIWIPGWAWPCPHHSSPWYPSWLLSVPTRNTQACLNASPSHTSLGHVTCWSCLTAWQSAVQLCMSLALPSLISGYTENWALSCVSIIFLKWGLWGHTWVLPGLCAGPFNSSSRLQMPQHGHPPPPQALHPHLPSLPGFLSCSHIFFFCSHIF